MKFLNYSSIRYCIFACALAACSAPVSYEVARASSIYWSDGDSGRIDGVDFRLADIDAPETGGVGAAIGGAKCENERRLGYEAKAFMVEITKNTELIILEDRGPDRYERRVVVLEADGHNIAEMGVAAGHLRRWPHKGRRSLSPKPDWCELE